MDIMTGGALISDRKELLQLDRIYELLGSTYWAKNREISVIQKSIENSLCFGVYSDDVQIGFSRCVTDYATAYWLCDVVIDERFRGRGLGKALIEAISEHEELKRLRGILSTNDAHGLYEKYGFMKESGRFMTKPRLG